GAIHERAAKTGLSPLDAGRHRLIEQADPAAAVEGHADAVLARGTVEIADEFRALVLARDDLAGARPTAGHALEKGQVAIICGGGNRASRGERGSRKDR